MQKTTTTKAAAGAKGKAAGAKPKAQAAKKAGPAKKKQGGKVSGSAAASRVLRSSAVQIPWIPLSVPSESLRVHGRPAAPACCPVSPTSCLPASPPARLLQKPAAAAPAAHAAPTPGGGGLVGGILGACTNALAALKRRLSVAA